MAGPTSFRDNKIVIKTAATFINRYPFLPGPRMGRVIQNKQGGGREIIISLTKSSFFFSWELKSANLTTI